MKRTFYYANSSCIYKNYKYYGKLPWQGFKQHFLVSSLGPKPEQFFASWPAGDGLLQWRLLVITPSPQEVEQLLHLVQFESHHQQLNIKCKLLMIHRCFTLKFCKFFTNFKFLTPSVYYSLPDYNLIVMQLLLLKQDAKFYF